MSRFLLTMPCLAMAAMPAVVHAQTPPPAATPTPAATATPGTATRTYTPADFARFAPRTALDMLINVPGFAIEGTEERRGFGEGSGNVVINGERISGKSNDALAELRRIPARRVQRIEIVDAATLGLSGLSGQVANIIVASGAVEVNYEWAPSYRPHIDQLRWLDGSISASGAAGPFTFNLGLDTNSYAGGGIGPEFVTDPAGVLIDLRDEEGTFYGYQPRLSGSLRYEAPAGGIGNLTASYQRFFAENYELSLRRGPGQPDRDRLFTGRDRTSAFEVGADYELDLFGGRFKMIGLRRQNHSPTLSLIVTDFPAGLPDTGTRYEVVADETETIARGEFRWRAGASNWRISLEGAFNTLDSAAELSTLAPNGQFVLVPLPGATSRIEERRAESILSWDRPLSPTLSMQAAAGGEYSNLRQIGPGGLDRSFFRPKGSLALAWRQSPRLTLNARLEREVGQLQFGSFLASVNIIGGNENSGNPNLVPQQSWNGEVEAVRSFGALGRATLRAYARLITDIVDQIPIGATGESPGNLDSATVWGMAFNGTLNLDPLGVRGAKFDLDLRLQDSSVEDPLTLLARPISVSLRRRIDARFRHDIPGTQLAYGASFFEQRNYDNFRLSELSNLYQPASLNVFAEHKDVAGLKVRFTVGNILGTNESYRRAVYVARRDGPLAFLEQRTRAYGPSYTLSISGSF